MSSFPNNVVWRPQAGSQEAFLASSPIFEVLYQGTRGGGKSLADFTPVITDNGWKRADDVLPTDRLMGMSGEFCNILGIYPQPLTEMRELVFRNTRGMKPTRFERPQTLGRKNYNGLTQIICSPDHKWLAKSNAELKWRVYTTDEMIETASKPGMKIFVPHMKYGRLMLGYWEDHPPTPHRCFAVDDPYRCFVINNGLVTHNTDCLLMSFAMFTGRGFGLEWRGVLFRRTYKELNDIINKSKKWFSQIFPQATFNNSEHFWRFPDGEELLLRQFKGPDSYWDYHGSAFPFIAWEELTNWPTDEGYRRMFSCSRSTVKGMPRMVRSTCNPSGCIPFGEVLTSTRGWVPIQEIEPGETVLSVKSDKTLTESVVSELIAKEWSGTMITRKGAGLDLTFTEDHRLPILNEDKSKFSLREFKDLPGHASILRSASGWVGEKLDRFTPPECPWAMRKPKAKNPESLSPEQYAELVGWLVSEGHAGECGFSITQMKEPHRGRIKDFLDECGFSYNENGKGFEIHSLRWGYWASTLGLYCDTKRIPDDLMRAEEPILRRLLDTLVAGDGHVRENSRGTHSFYYYTKSEKLAEQVSEICVKLGYAVRVTSRKREDRSGLFYTVGACQRESTLLITGNHIYDVPTTCGSVNVSRDTFSGTVYCLRVPKTETFFIRQNGCVWVSGNSGHAWVRDRFRPDTMNMQVRKNLVDENGRPEPPRLSIFSDIRENKILLEADPGYLDKIAASARNEGEKKAWLYGSWDIVSGGMFGDVWDSAHNVVKPFAIPENWRITRSFDWGSSKPFSVGWWAISNGEDYRDSDGRLRSSVRGDVFRIAEWYGFTGKPNEGLRLLAIDISKGIVERELRWGLRDSRNPSWTRVRPGPADSQIFAAENGNCIATDMKNRVRLDTGIEFPGITWLPADKRAGSRVTGWDQMRRALKNAHPNPNGPRELPGMFVFNTCEQFIRTIPVLPRDEKDPDDLNTEAEDHCFVSGTMVDLPSGQCAIESLQPFGEVMTDEGLRPYENPRVTRKATELVRLTMRDGRVITCTPDHKFMSVDRFWIPALYLRDVELYGGVKVETVEYFETEPTDVYCITVPFLGRFTIEGGIVVKNCADETRYLVRSLGQFASSGRVSGLS